jgi:serine/threonine protein phosphatase PrpC
MAAAPKLTRTAFGDTDVGRRRVSNEDAFGLDVEAGVFVVADGMGGHAAGEVASREAVDTVLSMMRKDLPTFREIESAGRTDDIVRRAKRSVEAAMQAATYMVFALAETDPDQRGMGTTLSTLLVAGDVGITGQVGDSRIYRIRNGEVTRLTEDHTLVAWQIKQGIISPQEAERSPHRNVITRAVGSRDYVQVDTHVFDLEPGDRFLLCSDGLHGYLHDDEIPGMLARPTADAVQELIVLANSRGGRDNITAIVVAID